MKRISTLAPFIGRQERYLPKCVCPKNDYSTIVLNRVQRDYVLLQYGYESYHHYLQSSLWFSIRTEILYGMVFCPCGSLANQVHHKAYTEANLLGKTLRGLVPICNTCHYDIEFTEGRKCSLGEANFKLKRL